MSKPVIWCVLFVISLWLTGCQAVPRVQSLWGPPSTLPTAAQPLVGRWKLVATDDQGSTPEPYHLRTITIAPNGRLSMSMWEHELTWKFRLLDDQHLEMTWIGSTNPNDKVGAVIEYGFRIVGDQLTFFHDDKVVYVFTRL